MKTHIVFFGIILSIVLISGCTASTADANAFCKENGYETYTTYTGSFFDNAHFLCVGNNLTSREFVATADGVVYWK
jgi:hypothetical protein